MKKILVALDLESPCHNQLVYSLKWADAWQAELHLLYVYQIPVVSADSFVYVPDAETLEKLKTSYIIQLQEMANHAIHETKINCAITIECCYGQTGEQILQYAANNQCDSILMGIQNKNFLSERVLGSTTTYLFRKSQVPVLAIHPESHFVQLKNILLAYDRKPFSRKDVFKIVAEMCTLFGAHVHVVSIEEELVEFPLLAETIQADHLDPMPPVHQTSYQILQNDSIINGLKEYCAHHDIDLITMIPRKHQLLERIISESMSKKIAFHAEIPVLAIHE